MKFQHRSLAGGRWREFSFLEQMANLGSEIERTIRWREKENHDYSRRAFERAFFGSAAWARPFVLAYARELELPREALAPLFVLGWARAVARFVDRLDGSAQPFSPGSSEWLRQNRYYAVWRHSLAHLDDLRWSDAP